MPNFEYCTVEDLRNEGITTQECTDERAIMLIRLASAKINVFTSQWFAPTIGDEYIDGQNSRMIWLPNFVPINKLSAISILPDRTARVGPYVMSDRRVYSIALTDVQLSRNSRVIELITNVCADLTHLPWAWYQDTMDEIWFPEGRRNVKLTGVYGWLDDAKDVESIVVGDWPERSAKIIIDDASEWQDGDFAIFPDGSMQIVTGVKKSTNELYFKGDPFKLKTALVDGGVIHTYGRTPILVRWCTIKLAHIMTPKLGDSSAIDDIVAAAIVSEKTDNYSYKLDPSLLRDRIEAGVGSTGDAEVDALLAQMIDEIPVYVGYV
jgi:hypothetical protein